MSTRRRRSDVYDHDQPVNDPPILTCRSITTTAGNTQLHVGARRAGRPRSPCAQRRTKSIPSDIDGPAAPASCRSPAPPRAAPSTLNADGSFTYVPNAGFTGTDSFSFQVTDGARRSPARSRSPVAAAVWYVSNEIGANNPPAATGARPMRSRRSPRRKRRRPRTTYLRVHRQQPDDAARRHHARKTAKAARPGHRPDLAGFGTIVPAGTRRADERRRHHHRGRTPPTATAPASRSAASTSRARAATPST